MKLGITERLMHCTVRIECVDAQGHASSGTGFFVVLMQQKDSSVPAIVTNRHVIFGTSSGQFHVSLKTEDDEPQYGSHQQVGFESGQWIFHPDDQVDLAILPIAGLLQQMEKAGLRPLMVPISPELFPNSDTLESLHAMEDITMIGYPNGIWDSVNNLPILRRGVTATAPYLNYNGSKEFVIDMPCFPGSSGSPVFILNMGGFSDKKGNFSLGANRVIFLGVLYAGPQQSVAGEIVDVPIPTACQPIAVSKMMINLGYCIKAERILEFENVFRTRMANQLK